MRVCFDLLKLRICLLSVTTSCCLNVIGLSCLALSVMLPASPHPAASFRLLRAAGGLPVPALVEGGDPQQPHGAPPSRQALYTWGFPYTWSRSLVCPKDRLARSFSQLIHVRFLEDDVGDWASEGEATGKDAAGFRAEPAGFVSDLGPVIPWIADVFLVHVSA